MTLADVTILNAGDLEELLDIRGISLEDITQVIEFAEAGGDRYCHSVHQGRVLTRLRIGSYCLYVNYSGGSGGTEGGVNGGSGGSAESGENGGSGGSGQGAYLVNTAYAHRLLYCSEGDGYECPSSEGPESKWVCARCSVHVRMVENVFLRYEDFDFPPIEGYRCPVCNFEMLSEAFVMDNIHGAELMLEAK